MHPFDFTGITSFVCEHPDSAFVFDPLNNNKFHWYGKELDKLGSYAVEQTNILILTLEWNYGREQSYPVLSFEGTGDAMTAFVLKNHKTGELIVFNR